MPLFILNFESMDFRIGEALTLFGRGARNFLSATSNFDVLVWRTGLGVTLVQFGCGAREIWLCRRKFRCDDKEIKEKDKGKCHKLINTTKRTRKSSFVKAGGPQNYSHHFSHLEWFAME